MYSWKCYFRVCLVCSEFSPPVDIFCNSCWLNYYELTQSKRNSRSENYKFPLHRLWVWNELSDQYVRPVVYNLKKGHDHELFVKLAQMFLSKVSFSQYKDENLIFIPAPAKYPKLNHALYFARGLSEVTGRPYFDVLKESLQKKVSQKNLTRIRRQNRKMFLKLSLKRGNRTRFIFVDDVVTSGSTAEAAYRALGQPKKFDVWVLAEKTLKKVALD